jgi:hypothetical protein
MQIDATTRDLIERRFWPKVVKSDQCWLWTAAKNEQGYGLLCLSGHMYKAHRLAYYLERGPFPDSLFVCHHCDTPACVKPSHLFLGTQKDNLGDAKRKGRTASGDRSVARRYPEKLQRGDDHWSHRIPERKATGDRHRSQTHPESIRRGEDHFFHKHPERVIRGERHANAKLTDAQREEVRQRYNAGGVSCKSLAGEYGVSPSLIHIVAKHKRR